jgi:hypothetical protein
MRFVLGCVDRAASSKKYNLIDQASFEYGLQTLDGLAAWLDG